MSYPACPCFRCVSDRLSDRVARNAERALRGRYSGLLSSDGEFSRRWTTCQRRQAGSHLEAIRNAWAAIVGSQE